MISRLAARTGSQAARSYSRSAITKEPIMHKAKGNWDALKAKRPIDHDDLHLVFHTPFNKATVVGMLFGVVLTGWGMMSYGFRHQQYKQGYWKK